MKQWKIFLGLLLLLALAAGIFGWSTWKELFGPGVAGDRIILIPTGSTMDQVIDSLRSTGVIKDETSFRMLAERKNYVNKVKPGRYKVRSGSSLNALVNMLRSGDQEPMDLTFTNVNDLPELAGRVARYLETDSITMLRALRDPIAHQKAGLNKNDFISLFIPNTYEFWWTTSPEKFIARMEQEHARFWNEDRKLKAKKMKMNAAEVATLASIVQAETMRISDAPRIAGVYLNRLRIGMPLQADPTLKFALGLDSLKRVLDRDKLVDSPYNTYQNIGLPPGPINMPEPRFLDAVLDAEEHDFLYFCAKADLSGYSDFTKTYEQHLVNARKYQRALNARKIYR
ncbi:MAG: endolytic transglycosylase MltG [Flavobacteriales bacterium]|nr:endolytic transglycosylase MltG [Flavobacteriales bacterium]